ncbi:HNH endonuclease signature motif containing protein [Pseudomonas sp. 10B1]|nr:HNH endonuclease signature motif containing protein [Pseudomonas sp. 10B1]
MAGDWIKIRADILDSPQFAAISKNLSLSSGDLLIALTRTASWFERHGTYGKIEADLSIVDIAIGVKGLASELIRAGWLVSHAGVLNLKSFCAPSATRKSLGLKVRAAVLSAGSCAACGAEDGLVVDHVIPVARGGSCKTENLQALCAPCNRQKGKKMPGEWRTH